jgi:hypothetical protein
LAVYVAGAGKAKPTNTLLDVPLGADGRWWTTETAFVGFFVGAIRDVIIGVRDDGKKKGTSWWVVLLAVLGSVVGAAALISTVVFYIKTRPGRRQDLDPMI